MTTDDNNDGASAALPLGFWLRTVDALITRTFADALADAGVDRRDWMLLNALSGEIELPAFAERFVRRGKRLRRLEERGWAEETGDGTWALTAEGRAVRDDLTGIVDGIRSRIAGAVSPQDYATTMASLEAIARELGWDEGQRMPRGGFGRGFGRGFGPAFGPSRGFGPEFGPEQPGGHCGHGHSDHGEHAGHPRAHHGHHHRGGHSGERAYERGFEAGFARGRTAS